MKRLLINTTILVLLAGTFSACKRQLEENYLNPELTTTGSMSKLFTGMFINKRIHPSYWDYYTFIMPTTAAYSQMTALAPLTQMYVPSLDYTGGRWTDFYNGSLGTDYNYSGPGILNSYREMQTSYNALTPAQQQLQEVFLKVAEVVLYDQTSQMVDLWGDIPFFNASSLNTDRIVEPAPFDDAKTIYDTLITNLKALNTYFATATLDPSISSELTAADPIFRGDLSKWQRYANSLRLRLLMRISNTDEGTAQAAVTEMLADPATYPLISDNSDNAALWMSNPTLRSDMRDALSGSPFAPSFLLDTLMLTNDDPRTEVYWDPNADNGWKSFPYNGTSAQYDARGFATYDSATFFYNYNVPGVLFTAAEASFLKAEAYERWSLGAAQTEYENGINQSIAFYYDIYHRRVARDGSGDWAELTDPTAEEINDYLAKPAIAYTGTTTQKLAKIYTQKWEHFFILQAGQAWAEYRRTGYPALQFATSSYSGGQRPPVRLVYPTIETLYNPNYSAVQAQDTRDTRIFWDQN
ncbi:SusD/RagB family nutrient-binding outer membrane lipoprotein [Chitinophaga japonensis]|uniref:SusD-like starch-binding protein associating with outer membrane n=1 Tax=Chitinophaga japonensis TaxID=104662 RepID=A0A562TGH6_CHIJA|nr:SusD/RagB family nutrient-binding outer membrane lipoprotein [Chitinophaga japonensis]TWI92344.1 SusD-like starch-binding protein associating with outer membrane [Chitinophaga japonensis]